VNEAWWTAPDCAIPSDRLRRALWLREDKPEIAGPYCAVEFREQYAYEVDHIVPLWKAPRDWAFWSLDNLRTLCLPHHRLVTADQARERAAMRAGGDRRQLSLLVAAEAALA
jgi:hypothetical protein